MWKLLRATKNESVILTLIGRIDGESLAELKRVIGLERDQKLVLDLKDVTVVDQSAIRFLVRCEAENVTLENSPAYIREWIAAEKHGNRKRKL
jgi:ABC-type transporter Mla MlaB component